MQTIRVLSGGHGGKGQRDDHRGEFSSGDVGNGDGGGDDATGSRFTGGSPGGGGRNGLFAPVPQRPDRSPSPVLTGSLLENSRGIATLGSAPTRRLGGRSPSPISRVLRRTSLPPNPRPWNFMDLRGEAVGSR